MSFLDPKFWFACLGAAALFFISGYVTHWKVAGSAQVKAELAQVKKDVKQGNDAAKTLEEKKDARAITYKEITKQADRVVVNHSGVCLDADGLSVINAALKGGASAKSDKAMSGANASR